MSSPAVQPPPATRGFAVEGEAEHGVDRAVYAGGPGEPYYQPLIVCLCGWSSGRCASWKEAGDNLDWHLKHVLPSKGGAPR